jgi:hypothetical protein
MPIEIPDLWGDDIKVDVLPPLIILKAQDEAIRRKTQGTLHTEIITAEEEQNDAIWVIHTLDLIAAAIGYRESILTVSHEREKLYPVAIEVGVPIEWTDGTPAHRIRCFSADEFIRELRAALQSPLTKSTIATLLARSNEERMKRERNEKPAT